MNVLITGGAGFIGNNLVRHLIREGNHRVFNVDALTYAGSASSLNDLKFNPDYQFTQTDVCDPERLEQVFRSFQPDWVMHLAAESHVDRSIDSPERFVKTNIVGTFNLLQIARDYFDSLTGTKRDRFRFLHLSTDEVYGTLGASGKFSEQSRYEPHSPYSATKASSDHLARAWHDTYGLPVLVTNCSNTYGPFQFPEKLIPLVILKALSDEKIPVYGKGQNIRDWIYVEDVCQALHTVIRAGEVGETYNIGGNNEQRNIDIVRLICALLDKSKPKAHDVSYTEQIEFVSDRPGHDFRYAIDADKIMTLLGWRPQENLNSGILKTIAWYLQNADWTARALKGNYNLERLGSPDARSQDQNNN